MNENNELDHQNWLKKAFGDELNAKSILTHRDGTPSIVCFLSQQMAEKLLKGLLVFKEKKFPKIHDLLELETLLLNFFSDITALDHDLDILSTYYFETRYPGDFPEFTWKDAEEAFEAAQKIKNLVLTKMNQ